MEERFPYRKPPAGPNKAAVVLDDDVFRIEHPAFRAPLSITLDNLAAVIASSETNFDGLVLRRDVRLLELPTSTLARSNIVLVFRSPVRIARFRFGAQSGLSISARERRRGLDVDGLGVTVEKPHDLMAALRHRGVTEAATVHDALRAAIGVPEGEDALRRHEEIRRRRARSRRFLVGWFLLSTVAIALQVAVKVADDSLTRAGGLVLSTLLWALAILLIVSRWPARRRRRGSGSRSESRTAAAFLVGLVAVFAIPLAVAWAAARLGVPPLLAYGMVGGIPSGVIFGVVLRMTRSRGAVPPTEGISLRP